MPINFKMMFDFSALVKMLSFSMWTLLETLSIWLGAQGGIFLLSNMMSSYYIGLYNASNTISHGVFSIFTASITPLFFSALSRLQTNKNDFQSVFYSVQEKMVLILAPIGVGAFFFRVLVVSIFLGDQWHDADLYVGLLGVVLSFKILTNDLASEALRAMGMPKISMLSQCMFFPLLFIVIYYTAPLGFEYLVVGTSLCSLELCLVKILLMKVILKFPLKNMFLNLSYPFGCALISGWIVSIYIHVANVLVSIFCFLFLYFAQICFRRDYRVLVFKVLRAMFVR